MQQEFFSLPQAAKLYNMDKSTPHRHAKEGRRGDVLSTSKELRNGKEVTVVSKSELIRFYGEMPKPLTEQDNEPQQQSEVAEVAILQERLQHLADSLEREREERERERKQLTEAKAVAEQRAEEEHQNAQQWRKQAEQQTLLLTHEQEQREKWQESTQKKRWWKFGK